MNEKNRETVALTGASGLIGTALTEVLNRRGYQVVGLARRSALTPQEPGWNPHTGEFSIGEGKHCDVLVHLAGESVAGFWTNSKKRAIRESRVDATQKLAKFIASHEKPPHTFLSASAIGIYGDRGDDILTENEMAGKGFLASVCTHWEDAARPAQEAGIRVVHPRFGVVLSSRSGALKAMLPIFQLGLGGVIGNGKQWMSWIALEDAAHALVHLIEEKSVRGACNMTAPQPVTNGDFTRTLASVLHRPAVLPVPAFALRLVLRLAAEEMLLSSARVLPATLQESGYQFRFSDLRSALENEIGR